jgi:aminoglycoside phosphotransferase (APT) family kinase protein
MRSHDQAQVKARCRAALPRVLAAMGERAPSDVRQDAEGWVNPCFFVDERLVVRFNARDAGVPKFRRERVAYELLREAGLPVPRVLFHDETRAHAPWEVLVTERLPGRSVESSWPSLDEPSRRRLAGEAGRLLARLHGIPVEGFGELGVPASERHATWLAWVRAHLRRVVADARRHDALDEATLATASGAVERHAAHLASRGAVPSRPAVVHGDFHLGNVLHLDGRVTGIVDLEWSLAGDPLFDLVTVNGVEEFTPGAREPILAAWRGERPGSADDDARFPLYRCFRNVELTTIARLHFTAPEAARARDVTTREIARLAAS